MVSTVKGAFHMVGSAKKGRLEKGIG